MGIDAGTGKSIAATVHNPISDHYNRKFTKDWRPNPTLHRERGYGVDHYFGKAGENKFYVQPNHMQNPRQKNYDRRVESWDGVPENTDRATVPVNKERWEQFYEQRKELNRLALEQVSNREAIKE